MSGHRHTRDCLRRGCPLEERPARRIDSINLDDACRDVLAVLARIDRRPNYDDPYYGKRIPA